MFRAYLVLVAALSLFSVPAAFAGEGCGAGSAAKKIFNTADTDKSGTLTRTEYDRAELQRFGAEFDEYDLDSDGEASLAEYLELYDRYHSGEPGVDL